MITIEEFLKAASEVDEKTGFSRTSLVADCSTINLATKDEKQIVSVSMQKPVIKIERHGDFVQLDFTFKSALDNDIKMLWMALELYGKTVSDVNPSVAENNVIASGSITLIPAKYEGRYFAVAAMPIFWSLTSLEPNEMANTVRVLVETSSFQVFEANNLDMDAIKKEAEDEISYRRRMEAEAVKKNNENKI